MGEKRLVHIERRSGNIFYVCDQCGFGYMDNETAQECERYCKSMGISSFVLTKKAVLMPAD